MVEDLTIEHPAETVVPTTTTFVVNTELRPDTGLLAAAAAAFDAEIEDLFS